MTTVEGALADLALGQDQPQKGEHAAPHNDRSGERDRKSHQSTSELSVGRVFTVAFASSLVVPQLAWLGGLGYVAHRLLF